MNKTVRNTLELEPSEREWLRVYRQGKEARTKDLIRSFNPYRGGWQQDTWDMGFDGTCSHELISESGTCVCCGTYLVED